MVSGDHFSSLSTRETQWPACVYFRHTLYKMGRPRFSASELLLLNLQVTVSEWPFLRELFPRSVSALRSSPRHPAHGMLVAHASGPICLFIDWFSPPTECEIKMSL